MAYKRKDHENLSEENIDKVIGLLEGENPITKKEACELLNIAYNTSRLQRILDEHLEKKKYIARRKKELRGKPASPQEVQEIVMSVLTGESIQSIAKGMFRSVDFVKSTIEGLGIPGRVRGEEGKHLELLPDQCISDTFSIGEIVWSAKYHSAAVILAEVDVNHQAEKEGYQDVNYEQKYAARCYRIYIPQKVKEGGFFPRVEVGGFNAYALAYDLGSLRHLEEFGVDLSRI